MSDRSRTSARLSRYGRRGAEYLVDRVLYRLDPYRPVRLQLEAAPSADNRPRYGHGRPAHPRIETILRQHRGCYREQLEAVLKYGEQLEAIPLHPRVPGELHWDNEWFSGMDIAVLYTLLRDRRPRRYIEVGSGNSTLTAHLAIRDGGLETEIVSIDPQPRAEVDHVCTRVIRRPLETVDPAFFTTIGPDDVVFVDASHRVFMNSDMVAFYLDVLPDLPAGTLVGIHDIFWPADYYSDWWSYWFSEQYLLGAFLLAGTPWLRPVLASYYSTVDQELSAVLDPLWQRPGLREVRPGGSAFWLQIDRNR